MKAKFFTKDVINACEKGIKYKIDYCVDRYITFHKKVSEPKKFLFFTFKISDQEIQDNFNHHNDILDVKYDIKELQRLLNLVKAVKDDFVYLYNEDINLIKEYL